MWADKDARLKGKEARSPKRFSTLSWELHGRLDKDEEMDQGFVGSIIPTTMILRIVWHCKNRQSASSSKDKLQGENMGERMSLEALNSLMSGCAWISQTPWKGLDLGNLFMSEDAKNVIHTILGGFEMPLREQVTKKGLGEKFLCVSCSGCHIPLQHDIKAAQHCHNVHPSSENEVPLA
ncbi:hypothetical protein RJT34_06265 [Clitoria ternatea]|uniref:Uncharacterized protein n=1 Tax=Clitoria ternatea TaxID=43366 RepID=A0AAN9K3L4_CLITE